jgi:hypothetical protein
MSDGANAVCWGDVPLASNSTPGLIFGELGYNTGNNVSYGVSALAQGGTARDTAIGYAAGNGIQSSSVGDNTALGYNALVGGAITGGCNTALGSAALAFMTSGSNNVGLGYQSGADALCTITTQNNNVILGNNTTAVVYSKVAPTNASDIRWKKVDGAVPLALPFVQALNPIKYQFCDPATGEVTDDRYRYGFSAQELLANEANPDHPIITRIDNPEMFGVNESMLLPVLVNAVKELSAELTALKAEVAALKQQA